MALQFTTTDQAAALQGIKALIYGKAGAGKTVLAATCPAPLILSAESGILSLRGVSIPMVKIETVDDLTEAYTWITTSPEAAQFQTIYIDSISEIGEVVLANAKKLVKDPRQAYGELIEKMTMTIRMFRDLPGKHVIMTAKQEKVKDEAAGTILLGPAMPGAKLAQALPYFFDEVFRLGIQKDPASGQEYRFLQTNADYLCEAKDRSGCLAPMEQPDMGAIINKIMAGTVPAQQPTGA